MLEISEAIVAVLLRKGWVQRWYQWDFRSLGRFTRGAGWFQSFGRNEFFKEIMEPLRLN